MYKTLALLSVAACMSACSTTPLPVAQTKSVDHQFVLTEKYALAKEGTQPITVIRNAGLFVAGGGSRYFISVDGIRVASLAPAEHVVLNLPKGEHVLGVSNGLFPADALQSVVVNVPTRVALYRVDSTSTAPLQPSLE